MQDCAAARADLRRPTKPAPLPPRAASLLAQLSAPDDATFNHALHDLVGSDIAALGLLERGLSAAASPGSTAADTPPLSPTPTPTPPGPRVPGALSPLALPPAAAHAKARSPLGSSSSLPPLSAVSGASVLSELPTEGYRPSQQVDRQDSVGKTRRQESVWTTETSGDDLAERSSLDRLLAERSMGSSEGSGSPPTFTAASLRPTWEWSAPPGARGCGTDESSRGGGTVQSSAPTDACSRPNSGRMQEVAVVPSRRRSQPQVGQNFHASL